MNKYIMSKCAFSNDVLQKEIEKSKYSVDLIKLLNFFETLIDSNYKFSKKLDFAVQKMHKKIELYFAKDPIAYVLSATYSKFKESEDEYNLRYIDSIIKASNLGNRAAIYSLAVNEDRGVFECNIGTYLQLLEKSSKLGFLPAVFEFGITLCESNQVDQGEEHILKAAKCGYELAIEYFEFDKVKYNSILKTLIKG